MIITTKVLPLFVSGQSWVAGPGVHMFSEYNFDNSAIFVSCECCRKKPKTAVGSFSNWKLSFVLSPTFEVSQRFYIRKKYIVHCTEVRCSNFPSGRWFTIATVSVHCISEWTKRKTGKFYHCAFGINWMMNWRKLGMILEKKCLKNEINFQKN